MQQLSLFKTGVWIQKIQVSSETAPDQFYTLGRSIDGVQGCSCPSWIYQRSPLAQRRPCKHLIRFAESLERGG